MIDRIKKIADEIRIKYGYSHCNVIRGSYKQFNFCEMELLEKGQISVRFYPKDNDENKLITVELTNKFIRKNEDKSIYAFIEDPFLSINKPKEVIND